jgi:asparagine synthase (glutamine-hydrolysing)
MCGIAGFWNPDFSPEQSRDLIHSMLATQEHRGPDYSGYHLNGPVALGHNLLKIIDLSDASKQPIHYGTLSITFNGEVYNYIELRRELERKGHVFTRPGDTEVILVAYKEWGERCVDHFVGMWAFAIWDSENQSLFCSRDRFGIKPFQYMFDGRRFFFASEYKALKLCPGFDGKVNIAQANRGLSLGWVMYRDETYFDCIKQIPPACNLFFSNGSLRVEQYWSLDNVKKVEMGADEKRDTFYSMFQESLRLHLRGQVKMGTCLSGGIDSSSIACSVAYNQPELPFTTFNIFYDNAPHHVDERPYVYDIMERYKSIRPHFFSPGQQEIEEAFLRCTYHADVPLTGSSYVSHYFMMRQAQSEGLRVLIDGQGSDEYLGGYLHSFYPLLSRLISQGKIWAAVQTLHHHIRNQHLSSSQVMMILAKTAWTHAMGTDAIYSSEHGRQLRSLGYNGLDSKARFNPQYSKNQLENFLQGLIFTTSLPTLLHFNDRNAMSYSIETRVPFLDHRLVEFAFSTPDSDKINAKAETKHLLREAMRTVLPASIVERKDKKGFVTPGESDWLRGPLRHYLDFDAGDLHWLEAGKVKAIMEEYKAGSNRQAKLVWRLASLRHWMQQV